MIVVIDTSVVLNLCYLHQEGLLTSLYHQLIAPSAVRREFERLATFDERFKGLAFPEFIEVQDASTIPNELKNAISLDEGEIAALALAVERKIRDVLIDELPARHMAEQLGLRVSGLLGVLIRAKQAGFLESVKPLLDALQEGAHFWIAPELIEQVLEAAGENS
ncbi:MAG TPA: DUF3368 domain-containing protein [Candidatus Udaeobacter sp.]